VRAGVAEAEDQRRGQVRQERKGVRGVDDERGESGGHVGFEVAPRFALLPAGQLLPAAEDDATGGQKRDEVSAIAVRLLADLREQLLPQALEQLSLRLGLSLAEQGHALHEELVQVRREDRQEFHPLEQRGALIERFRQHAGIEIEPAQITVDPHVGQRRRQRRVQDSVIPDRCPHRNAHDRPPT
jgi:hypothetical protein